MSFTNICLFILSFLPLLLTGFNISLLASQGRKHWRQINYIVVAVAMITFAHSCWQISFFFDESYYLLIPFPQDYFSHFYFFVVPSLLACLTLPKMYPNLTKVQYMSLILSVILSVLAIFAFQGKDLIWFSVSLSLLLIFVGQKEEQFSLFYRHYIKYLFLENTWVALFYFQSTPWFIVGLALQLAARFYLFHYLNLFWVSSFLKSHQSKKEVVPTSSELA